MDSNGRKDTVSCFSPDENTEVHNSCSLTWKNGFYVFAGNTNKNQISQVIGKKLTVIGKLNDMIVEGGACTVLADKIFLCFGNQEQCSAILLQ